MSLTILPVDAISFPLVFEPLNSYTIIYGLVTSLLKRTCYAKNIVCKALGCAPGGRYDVEASKFCVMRERQDGNRLGVHLDIEDTGVHSRLHLKAERVPV